MCLALRLGYLQTLPCIAKNRSRCVAITSQRSNCLKTRAVRATIQNVERIEMKPYGMDTKTQTSEILADLLVFSICRYKKCCLQTPVQTGHSKSTIEQTWYQHRSKMAPIWPRGWQRIPTKQPKYEETKNANTKHLNENNIVFNVRRIPQKTEGSTVGR